MFGNYLQSVVQKYVVEDNDVIGLGQCKVVIVRSELEAYKISELLSFGTDFLEVFESNYVWKCYAAEIRHVL